MRLSSGGLDVLCGRARLMMMMMMMMIHEGTGQVAVKGRADFLDALYSGTRVIPVDISYCNMAQGVSAVQINALKLCIYQARLPSLP